MKKGQKYVVRCKKAVNGDDVGLSGRFRKGQFLTFEGTGVKNLDKAHIYTYKEDEFLDFEHDDEVSDYFESVKIKIILDK